jgi:sec-independent protein translocase protein TatA
MDALLILVVILVVVLVLRGPKTLPKLGAAFGRGVKEARRELESKEDQPEDDERT